MDQTDQKPTLLEQQYSNFINTCIQLNKNHQQTLNSKIKYFQQQNESEEAADTSQIIEVLQNEILGLQDDLSYFNSVKSDVVNQYPRSSQEMLRNIRNSIEETQKQIYQLIKSKTTQHTSIKLNQIFSSLQSQILETTQRRMNFESPTTIKECIDKILQLENEKSKLIINHKKDTENFKFRIYEINTRHKRELLSVSRQKLAMDRQIKDLTNEIRYISNYKDKLAQLTRQVNISENNLTNLRRQHNISDTSDKPPTKKRGKSQSRNKQPFRHYSPVRSSPHKSPSYIRSKGIVKSPGRYINARRQRSLSMKHIKDSYANLSISQVYQDKISVEVKLSSINQKLKNLSVLIAKLVSSAAKTAKGRDKGNMDSFKAYQQQVLEAIKTIQIDTSVYPQTPTPNGQEGPYILQKTIEMLERDNQQLETALKQEVDRTDAFCQALEMKETEISLLKNLQPSVVVDKSQKKALVEVKNLFEQVMKQKFEALLQIVNQKIRQLDRINGKFVFTGSPQKSENGMDANEFGLREEKEHLEYMLNKHMELSKYQVNQLLENIEQLEAEKNELSEMLHKQKSENYKMISMNDRINELEQSNDDISEVRELLAASELRAQQLSQELKQFKIKNDKMELENQFLAKQIQETQNNERHNEANFEKLQTAMEAEIKDATFRIEELVMQNRKLNEQIDNLSLQTSSDKQSQTRIQELTTECRKQRGDIENSARIIEQQESKIQQLENDKKVLVTKQNEQLKKIAQEDNQKEKEYELLKDQLQDTLTQLDLAKEEAQNQSELLQKANEQIQSYQTQLESSNNSNTSLQQQIDALIQQQEKSKKQIQEYQESESKKPQALPIKNFVFNINDHPGEGIELLKRIQIQDKGWVLYKTPQDSYNWSQTEPDESFINLSDLQNILKTISDILQEPNYSMLPDMITDLKVRASESHESSYQFNFPIDMLNITEGDLQSERSSVTIPHEGMLDGTQQENEYKLLYKIKQLHAKLNEKKNQMKLVKEQMIYLKMQMSRNDIRDIVDPVVMLLRILPKQKQETEDLIDLLLEKLKSHNAPVEEIKKARGRTGFGRFFKFQNVLLSSMVYSVLSQQVILSLYLNSYMFKLKFLCLHFKYQNLLLQVLQLLLHTIIISQNYKCGSLAENMYLQFIIFQMKETEHLIFKYYPFILRSLFLYCHIFYFNTNLISINYSMKALLNA